MIQENTSSVVIRRRMGDVRMTESPPPQLALDESEPEIIRLERVSKHYRIWNSSSTRLLYSLLSQTHKSLRFALERDTPLLTKVARWRDSLRENYEALHEVSFRICRGESVGIIGRNGSGKSTLLQLIARTLWPTTGTIETDGRVAAMLELGSGFNPDFTGRENLYLNGAILGLTKDQIEARQDAIIEFADLGMFIDQPVKTYSSGMVVRLGFAVLTQIEPEILIVDEALAVGDFLFQQRCFDFIRRFKDNGGTLLFVSHAMSTVMELCDRALLLDSGHLAFDGPVRDAVNLYEASALRSRFQTGERPLQIVVPERRHEEAEGGATSPHGSAQRPEFVDQAVGATEISGESLGLAEAASAEEPPEQVFSREELAAELGSVTSDDASLQFVRLAAVDGKERDWFISEEEVVLTVGILCTRRLHDPHVGFKIRDRLGRVIFETSSLCMGKRIGAVVAGQRLLSRFRFGLPIAPGEYSITIGFANGAVGDSDYEEALLYQHGVRTFQVYKNKKAIIWSGVFNLHPHVEFSKQDAFAEASPVGNKREPTSHA